MKINRRRYPAVAFLILSLAILDGAVLVAGSPANSLAPAPPASAAASGLAGALTGIVKLDGPAPRAALINMAQEPACAKMHSASAASEEVVTGQGGSLANVIVYISEGVKDPGPAAPGTPAVIAQKGCMYQPHVLAMQAGQDLQIINDDPTSHNIHPMPVNNREWNKSQPPGMAPIDATFAREEISIPVKCNIHPWMKSYIAVFKNSYFAVTSKDGSFSLPNLPPGNYTITAWHEKYGSISQAVTLAPNAPQAVTMTFKSKSGMR
jgi:plastocyanin